MESSDRRLDSLRKTFNQAGESFCMVADFFHTSSTKTLSNPVSRGSASSTKRSGREVRGIDFPPSSWHLGTLSDANRWNSEECSRKEAPLRGKALYVIREIAFPR